MKSQVIHPVILLVRLQGKFEIDHSWEWKGLSVRRPFLPGSKAITLSDLLLVYQLSQLDFLHHLLAVNTILAHSGVDGVGTWDAQSSPEWENTENCWTLYWEDTTGQGSWYQGSGVLQWTKHISQNHFRASWPRIQWQIKHCEWHGDWRALVIVRPQFVYFLIFVVLFCCCQCPPKEGKSSFLFPNSYATMNGKFPRQQYIERVSFMIQ